MSALDSVTLSGCRCEGSSLQSIATTFLESSESAWRHGQYFWPFITQSELVLTRIHVDVRSTDRNSYSCCNKNKLSGAISTEIVSPENL